MKRLNSILLGTTAAILVLGGAPASAQKAPDASGSAQMQGDTKMQGGADTQSGASAQGGAEAQGSAQAERGGGGSDSKMQGSAQSKQGGSDSDMQGRAQKDQRDSKSDMQGRADKGQSDSKSDTKDRAESKQGDSEGGSTGRALGGSEQGGGDRAGAGGGDKGDTAVQFTEEHKTKLTTYFKQNKVSVEPVQEVSVSISVGTVVPQTIELHPLPQTIVVDLPHDHEYLYFVYERDIIVVIADTREIVYVVSNVV